MEADVIVVGAGCIGASIAKHLAEAGHAVRVLEKEPRPAMHQSGRNSGVIHAGYNLKPGSDKARFCVQGNRQMRAYCKDRDVPLVEGGILVVASNEHQRAELRRLEGYASENQVPVSWLEEDEIAQVEPAAAGVAALHAPTGSSVDSVRYVEALVADARRAGAVFEYGARVDAPLGEGTVVVDGETRTASVVVNAGGLHADRLAGPLAEGMRIVPFRGYYAQVTGPSADLVRSHVYQAPDARFPFLGVHVSRRTDGTVMAGPGAMLAFGREAYRFWGMQPRDLASTLAWPGFWRTLPKGVLRRLPGEVHKSLRRKAIAKEARHIIGALRAKDLRPGPAGNRAQLIDRAGNLVDDILVRSTRRCVHVLNAVSPGLTCSLPFGRHIAELVEERL